MLEPKCILFVCSYRIGARYHPFYLASGTGDEVANIEDSEGSEYGHVCIGRVVSFCSFYSNTPPSPFKGSFTNVPFPLLSGCIVEAMRFDQLRQARMNQDVSCKPENPSCKPILVCSGNATHNNTDS